MLSIEVSAYIGIEYALLIDIPEMHLTVKLLNDLVKTAKRSFRFSQHGRYASI